MIYTDRTPVLLKDALTCHVYYPIQSLAPEIRPNLRLLLAPWYHSLPHEPWCACIPSSLRCFFRLHHNIWIRFTSVCQLWKLICRPIRYIGSLPSKCQALTLSLLPIFKRSVIFFKVLYLFLESLSKDRNLPYPLRLFPFLPHLVDRFRVFYLILWIECRQHACQFI